MSLLIIFGDRRFESEQLVREVMNGNNWLLSLSGEWERQG